MVDRSSYLSDVRQGNAFQTKAQQNKSINRLYSANKNQVQEQKSNSPAKVISKLGTSVQRSYQQPNQDTYLPQNKSNVASFNIPSKPSYDSKSALLSKHNNPQQALSSKTQPSYQQDNSPGKSQTSYNNNSTNFNNQSDFSKWKDIDSERNKPTDLSKDLVFKYNINSASNQSRPPQASKYSDSSIVSKEVNNIYQEKDNYMIRQQVQQNAQQRQPAYDNHPQSQPDHRLQEREYKELTEKNEKLYDKYSNSQADPTKRLQYDQESIASKHSSHVNSTQSNKLYPQSYQLFGDTQAQPAQISIQDDKFKESTNKSLREQKDSQSKLADDIAEMKGNMNEINNSQVQLEKASKEQSRSLKRLEESRNDIDQIREQVQNLETSPSDAVIRYIKAQFEQYSKQQQTKTNKQAASPISNTELNDLRADMTELIQSSIQQQELITKQKDQITRLSLKVEQNEEKNRQSNVPAQQLYFEGVIADLIARMDHTDNKIAKFNNIDSNLQQIQEQYQKELKALLTRLEYYQKESKNQISQMYEDITNQFQQMQQQQSIQKQTIQSNPKPVKDDKLIAEIKSLQDQMNQAQSEQFILKEESKLKDKVSLQKNQEFEKVKVQSTQHSNEIQQLQKLVELMQKQIQELMKEGPSQKDSPTPDGSLNFNKLTSNTKTSERKTYGYEGSTTQGGVTCQPSNQRHSIDQQMKQQVEETKQSPLLRDNLFQMSSNNHHAQSKSLRQQQNHQELACITKTYEMKDFKCVTLFKLNGFVAIESQKSKLTILDNELNFKLTKALITEGSSSYFFSCYNYKNFILCCYDNGDIFILDTQSLKPPFQLQAQMSCDRAILQFLEFDDQFMIAAGQRGYIGIIDMTTHKIVSQFENEDDQLDDIIEIQRTTRKENEFMLLMKNGLRFMQIQKASNAKRSFTFKIEIFEQYFNDKVIKGAVEFVKDSIVVLVNGSKQISIIDRKLHQVESNGIINPSGSTNYYAMKKVPNYDFQSSPLILIKDQKCISVLDIKHQRILKIIDCSYVVDMVRSFNLDSELTNGTDLSIYTIEYQQNKGINGEANHSNTYIRKINLDIQTLCFQLEYDDGAQ